jgi:hypothetical protein
MNRRVGDIVLIYYQEQPTIYGRIESIEPDSKRGWYQLGLMLLSIPPQVVTWILRDAYIEGDSFTMGGKSVRLEFVEKVTSAKEPDEKEESRRYPGKSGKVIPFRKPD